MHTPDDSPEPVPLLDLRAHPNAGDLPSPPARELAPQPPAALEDTFGAPVVFSAPLRPTPTISRPGDLAGALDAAVGRLSALTLTPEHQAAVAQELARQRENNARTLHELARAREIPDDEDLRSVALDDDAHETPALLAFRAAVNWRGGARRGCVRVVGGPPGTGKSAGLAHVTLRFDGAAVFVPAPEIAATPRNGWSNNAAAWARWLSVPLLAVDDLGTETGEASAIAALLAQRYDAGRLTLVSTNLDRTALTRRYLTGELGSRIADRLLRAQGRDGHATGLPWYVWVEGGSLRSPAARAALAEGRGR